jgi:hypothetical protein
MLIPIVLLGMPASGRDSGGGGMLAQLRSEHDLGESDLGQIDPTSATMSFVLLGMRGIAVNMLRMKLDEYKDHKEWALMRSTTEAVITLQPHYVEVWRFLGWNMAWNVSAEWDAVPDRYYWVKEGGKFYQRGTRRNETIPELTWETGRVWGQKIGLADEQRYFRRYFKQDPDTATFGRDGRPGVDPEINPNQLDNYLVAKEWFEQSNAREDNRPQHIMMRALFRSQPARAQLSYAGALQKDVRFITAEDFKDQADSDKQAEAMAYDARGNNFKLAQQEWAEGLTEWTTKFGQEEFQTMGGIIRLEATEDDVRELASRQKEQGVTEQDIRTWIDRYQKTTNYTYWRTRAQAEADESTGTAEAHRLIYEGELKLRAGNPEEAKQMLFRGMTRFAGLMTEYPDLSEEDLTVEEAMWAVLLWKKSLELLGEKQPSAFPLKATWDKYQVLVPELMMDYNRGR